MFIEKSLSELGPKNLPRSEHAFRLYELLYRYIQIVYQQSSYIDNEQKNIRPCELYMSYSSQTRPISINILLLINIQHINNHKKTLKKIPFSPFWLIHPRLMLNLFYFGHYLQLWILYHAFLNVVVVQRQWWIDSNDESRSQETSLAGTMTMNLVF